MDVASSESEEEAPNAYQQLMASVAAGSSTKEDAMAGQLDRNQLVLQY